MSKMNMTNMNRIVVKVGTSTLTYENGSLNLRRIEQLIRVLSDLKNAGKEIVLVSSGAIGVGVERLGLGKKPDTTPGKQAAAAVGQCRLIFTYDKIFSEYGQTVAQVLLTRDIIEDQVRKQNTINTLHTLLEMGVIPIINENDTVAGEISVFGDNDYLSAVVAKLCGADMLMILTDTAGLFDSDPRSNKSAHLIHRVDQITPELFDYAGGSGTARGTGGMITKLEAAQRAVTAGIATVILSGENPSDIYDVLDGKEMGTLFTVSTHKGGENQ